MGQGQFQAVAVHEVRKRITARGSEVTVRWAPAYQRVEGNEMADTWAKAAADGSSYEDERAYLRVMRLSHMTRMSTSGYGGLGVEPRGGQQTIPTTEGRNETGASVGKEGLGRPILPVLDRTRLDRPIPMPENPHD